MKCKACGNWFSSTDSKAKLCIGCERAMARLYGYAEPVIRCKDCKYSKRYELGGYYRHECTRTTGNMSVDENDYCSHAKRKEDES